MLKLQKSGKSENSNIVTEEVKKTELSANEDKRVQSINLIEKYVHGTNKDLV